MDSRRAWRSPAGRKVPNPELLMDGFTRYALRIEVDTSLPGLRGVRVLKT